MSGPGDREEWLNVLRRRAAGLPDEEGEPIEVPVVVGLFDRKPKTAADFKAPSKRRGKKRQVDDETVAILTELLERAKAGEIVGLVAVAKQADHPGQDDSYEWLRTQSMDDDRHSVIGQLNVLQTWFTEEALDEALGVNDEIETLEGDE